MNKTCPECGSDDVCDVAGCLCCNACGWGEEMDEIEDNDDE